MVRIFFFLKEFECCDFIFIEGFEVIDGWIDDGNVGGFEEMLFEKRCEFEC